MAHQRLAAFVLRDQDDERGEVVVLVAEAVVEPGADARPAGDLVAALHERHTGAVIDAFGVHRAHEAELVCDLRRPGEQFRHPSAAVAVLLECERRANERNRALVARHAGEPLAAAHAVGQLLAGLFNEIRLVVEQIELRRPARLKKIDHPLRLRREVEPAEHAAGSFSRRRRAAEHLSQRDAAEPHAERSKQLPPPQIGAWHRIWRIWAMPLAQTTQIRCQALISHRFTTLSS